jgi:hypothetical protein
MAVRVAAEIGAGAGGAEVARHGAVSSDVELFAKALAVVKVARYFVKEKGQAEHEAVEGLAEECRTSLRDLEEELEERLGYKRARAGGGFLGQD